MKTGSYVNRRNYNRLKYMEYLKKWNPIECTLDQYKRLYKFKFH